MEFHTCVEVKLKFCGCVNSSHVICYWVGIPLVFPSKWIPCFGILGWFAIGCGFQDWWAAPTVFGCLSIVILSPQMFRKTISTAVDEFMYMTQNECSAISGVVVSVLQSHFQVFVFSFLSVRSFLWSFLRYFLQSNVYCTSLYIIVVLDTGAMYLLTLYRVWIAVASICLCWDEYSHFW